MEGNTERELLLHRKFPMLQHYAGNRANKNKIFFQERSGLNSFTESGKWLSSSSLKRSFYLEVETDKDPVHSALLSAVSNEILFAQLPGSTPKINVKRSTPFLWTRGEKNNKKSNL